MKMFPQLTWKKQVDEKILYITFDDGPCPGVTENVLQLLDKHQAKATFFCVGNNVNKYPALYHTIIKNEHSVGNHTHQHLNGVFTKNASYFEDIELASTVIESNFFRPPYGKLKTRQMYHLRKKYDIIMWDFLTADFDPELDIEICKKKMDQYINPGSIVVFHDSIKAEKNLTELLPYFLEKYSAEGYAFHAL